MTNEYTDDAIKNWAVQFRNAGALGSYVWDGFYKQWEIAPQELVPNEAKTTSPFYEAEDKTIVLRKHEDNFFLTILPLGPKGPGGTTQETE